MKKYMIIFALLSVHMADASGHLHGLWATVLTSAQVALKAQRKTALKNAAKALSQFEKTASSSGIKDGRGEVLKHRVEAYQHKLQNDKEKFCHYRSALYGGGSLSTLFASLYLEVPCDMASMSEWGFICLGAASVMTACDGMILNPHQIDKAQVFEAEIQKRVDKMIGDIASSHFSIKTKDD